MDHQITVEELYTLVWQRPILHIAREFGVSNTALSKCCKKYGIPTPGAGHWTKVQLGISIETPPLSLGAGELSAPVILPQSSPMDSQAKQTKRDRLEVDKVLSAPIVDDCLDNSHPIVEHWLRDENCIVSDASNKESQTRSISEYDDFRLRVTSAFIKSVESHGVDVTEANLNGRFVLNASGARLVAIIRQKMSEVRREGVESENWTRWPEHHSHWLYPTKDLKFSLKGDCIQPLEFSCSQSQVLKKGLKRFVVCVLAAQRAKRRREQEQYQDRKEQQRIRAEQALQRNLEQKEQKRWVEFQEAAEQWQHAQKLRLFIQRLREHVNDSDTLEIEGKPIETWLDWAQSRVNEIDPSMRPERLFSTD